MLKVRTIAALTAPILIFTVNVMAQTNNKQLSKELVEAARAGNTAGVKEIIESSPSIVNEKDDADETPILAALFRGHREIVQLLVASGTRLSIFEATCLGKIERVRELLKEQPGSVNSKGFNGATALHFAAFLGRGELVSLLLENKAEVNVAAPGFGNPTPLHSAVANNHPAIVEMLLAKGADINAKQDGGLTPLHETALAERRELAQMLIGKGTDLNVKDDHGRTALMIAVENQKEAMIELLRQSEAK